MRDWLMVLAILAPCAAPAFADPPAPDVLRAGAAAVRDRALTDPTAYDYVESLSVDVGQRLAGSEATPRATAWAEAELTKLGFANVHREPFQIIAWLRGPESAEITTPHPQKLAIIGLGGSVPTPPQGIEAEIVVVRTYAELLDAPPGAYDGKIAVLTQPMVRTQDGSGYGADNPPRRQGPSEAARRGALAYLVRSLATGESREPHTGALNYASDAPKIPAAALSVIDAELIDHLAARGVPIRVRLKLDSTTKPATVWTVEGEFRGTEHPDQIVQLGGHLDSWDPGTGSIDDGAGMAIAVAAAKLAAAQNPPRRSIRVALFGAEEMDFARPAFAAAHVGDRGDRRVRHRRRSRVARRAARRLARRARDEDLRRRDRAALGQRLARSQPRQRRRHRRSGSSRRTGVLGQPGRQPLLRLAPLRGGYARQGRPQPAEPGCRHLGGVHLHRRQQRRRLPRVGANERAGSAGGAVRIAVGGASAPQGRALTAPRDSART